MQLMDRLKIAARTWAKAVENAPRLRAALTALTHFFNLTTTPTKTENLEIAVFNKTRLSRYRRVKKDQKYHHDTKSGEFADKPSPFH
jgi:hypothetical protein